MMPFLRLGVALVAILSFATLARAQRALSTPGQPTGPAQDVEQVTNEAQTRDQEAYSAAIKERLLPIRRLPTVEPALPLVRAAGFADVQVVAERGPLHRTILQRNPDGIGVPEG